MDIRNYHIQSYLGDQKVLQIIGHSFFFYIKMIAGPLLVLLLLAAVRYVMPASFRISQFARAVGWIGVMIYIVACYQILDYYLDALVVTNSGLILYKWDGLFSKKVQNFQRVSIESIAEEKNGIRATLFDMGDIVITVEDKRIVFRDVQDSSTIISQISDRKYEMLYHHDAIIVENTALPKGDKFDILVETLSEVIEDYLDKKSTKDQEYY